jgi:hypothetical protein
MGTREPGDLGRCPLRAVRRGAYGGAYRRACRIAVSAALLAALTACRAPSPRVAAPAPPPPPAAHELGGASYDWHGLLIAPFGSVLKNIPAALHEVLLFRDEEHGSASAADADTVGAECYAADTPAPRFLGRNPDEYVLCFKQDRLFRIQASVRIAAAQAADVFAVACADWLKNAAPAITGDGACEGRVGDIRVRGRLEGEQDPAQPDRAQPDRAQPDRAEQGRAEMVVSITLDGAAAP